uniref:ENTH domain-containing protein n=1 Tax=Macrostomum lignano TaxID=282301 RepID=A0A1I8FR95_9PLAT
MNKAKLRRVYKVPPAAHLIPDSTLVRKRVVTSAREHIYDLRGLESYQFVDERGKDEGINIRHKAHELVEFIQDDDKLREERKAARKNRDKYTGYSGNSFSGGSGFGSGGYGGGAFSDNYGGGGRRLWRPATSTSAPRHQHRIPDKRQCEAAATVTSSGSRNSAIAITNPPPVPPRLATAPIGRTARIQQPRQRVDLSAAAAGLSRGGGASGGGKRPGASVIDLSGSTSAGANDDGDDELLWSDFASTRSTGQGQQVDLLVSPTESEPIGAGATDSGFADFSNMTTTDGGAPFKNSADLLTGLDFGSGGGGGGVQLPFSSRSARRLCRLQPQPVASAGRV